MQATGDVGAQGALLITPPAVVGARASVALDFVLESGFEVVSLCRIQVEPSMVRALWSRQLAAFGEERVEVMARLFGLGPSVLLVVRAVHAERTGSVPEALKRLQGPSSPGDLRPGHLRHRMGAINKLNNLVHVPDDPAGFVREVTILLGREGFDRLSATAHLHESIAADALRALLAPPSRREIICPVTRCVDLLDRLIVKGGGGADLPASLVTGVATAITRWRRALSRVPACASAIRRRALRLDGGGRLIPVASSDGGNRAVLELAAAVEACLATGVVPRLSVLEAALARGQLTEWDYVMLATETHASIIEGQHGEMLAAQAFPR